MNTISGLKSEWHFFYISIPQTVAWASVKMQYLNASNLVRHFSVSEFSGTMYVFHCLASTFKYNYQLVKGGVKFWDCCGDCYLAKTSILPKSGERPLTEILWSRYHASNNEEHLWMTLIWERLSASDFLSIHICCTWAIAILNNIQFYFNKPNWV